MKIWSLLKLSRTSDIRAIKRAYAKQLKVTRPDEKPEEFQALHHAYKAALNYAQKNNQMDNISSVPLGKEGTKYSEPEPHFSNESSSKRGSLSTESIVSPQEELASLQEKIDVLLRDKKGRQLIKNWCFLTESSFVLDSNFHWELSKLVLLSLFKHKEKLHKEDMPAYEVRAPVLFYLDGIFNWLHNESLIRNQLGSGLCDALFPAIYNFITHKHDADTEIKEVESLRGACVVKSEEPFIVSSNKIRKLFSYLIGLSVILIFSWTLVSFTEGYIRFSKSEVLTFFIISYSVYFIYR